MELTKENVEVLLDVIDTAQLVGITDIAFKDVGVGGIENDRTAVIFSTKCYEFLDGVELAINRPSLLVNRLGLCMDDPNFKLKCEIDTKSNAISRLTAKSKRTSIEYRCANPDYVEIPTKINNQTMLEGEIDTELLGLMQKSQSAMHVELIKLGVNSTNDGYFEFVDMNNDTCTSTMGLVYTNDSDGSISFKYNAKMLLQVLRKALKTSTTTFSIGNRGLIEVIINDISVFITPKV
jgi:hypothetical protein